MFDVDVDLGTSADSRELLLLPLLLGTVDNEVAVELVCDINADFNELLLPVLSDFGEAVVALYKVGFTRLTAAASAAISSAKTFPNMALVAVGKLQMRM